MVPMARDSSVTILIVDDDEGHAWLIRRNLRRAGVNNVINILSSGRSALDYIFRRGTFADRKDTGQLVVLLDVKMQGRYDGIDVLRQIKEDPSTREITVVMLTTTDDPAEIDRCYKLGCNIYVKKPVDPHEFIEAIKRIGLMISVMSVHSGPKKPP